MKTLHYINKLICTLILFLGCTTGLFAQNDYISNSRLINEDRIDDLNGDRGILLISKHKDLVIYPVGIEKKDFRIKVDGKREDGLYEYRVIFNQDATRNPKLEVSREGNVYKTEFTNVIKPDFLIAYLIEEVTNPIRMDDQTQPSDFVTDAKLAELEFTTSIKNLQINCPIELQAKIERKNNPSDANIHITSVLIPIAVLEEAKAKMELAQKEYKDWFSKLEEDEEASGQDANWDKLEELEQKRDAIEMAYSELTNLEIYADLTNHLSINISDLKGKMKKCYAVLELVKTDTVIVAPYDAKIAEGNRLFGIRKYKEAKEIFILAKNEKGTNATQRKVAQTSINLCDSCIVYDAQAGTALREVIRIRKEGGTQQEVYKYVNGAINFIQKLYHLNPSVFYSERIDRLERQLEKQPLFIMFTCVEWKTLQEGNALQALEIWAYKGKQRPLASAYNSARKFQKLTNKQTSDFELIGITNEKGVVELEFNRAQLPNGLFFRPKDVGKTKIEYKDMQDIMLQTKGDFTHRQIRMKMYTK